MGATVLPITPEYCSTPDEVARHTNARVGKEGCMMENAFHYCMLEVQKSMPRTLAVACMPPTPRDRHEAPLCCRGKGGGADRPLRIVEGGMKWGARA